MSGAGAEIHGDEEETTLLTPSMTRRMFLYKNGRRYSAIGNTTPLLPNDEEEIYRLELLHKAITRVQGGLHSFPGERFARALDAGCGPGWWAIDFADAHPDCEVIGVDIVPIQPQEIPPNLSFECDDICQGLRFPEGHFDVIYSRNLCASLTDWPLYLRELVRLLKPGGYLNCVESDIECATPFSVTYSALAQWNEGLSKTYKQHGLRPSVSTELGDLMSEVGLVDVREKQSVLPGGKASRENGAHSETAELMTQVALLNLSALSTQYGVANDIHDEALGLFISEVRRAVLNPALEWHTALVSSIGRKI